MKTLYVGEGQLMKRWMAILLAAALLLGFACAPAAQQTDTGAQSAAASAAVQPEKAPEAAATPEPAATPDPQTELDEAVGFVEDGDSAYYVDGTGENLTERVMACFDAEGNLVSVKERFIGKEAFTQEQIEENWNFVGKGEWNWQDNALCMKWDDDAVSSWFGGLSRAEIEARLAQLPQQMPDRTIDYQTIPFGEQIYKGNGLEITLENVQFAQNESIGLTLNAKSTSKALLMYRIYEVYINDWCVDLPSGSLGFVPAGMEMPQTFWAGGAGSATYRGMNIEDVHSVSVQLAVMNASGKWLKAEYSKVVGNPAGVVAGADDPVNEGEILLDSDTAKVIQRRFDAKNGRVELYVEKKESSKWSDLWVDATFDGYGGTDVVIYSLRPGVRTILQLDGKEVCSVNGISEVSEIDVYLTCYTSTRVLTPERLTIQNPNAPEAPTQHKARGEVVFDCDYCTIRYLGVNDAYFSNSDVILLECENKTEDRYLSIYQAFNYLLLDDEIRAEARMSGANCYPGSITTMALYPQSTDYDDLSAYHTAQLKLGVYQIKGGYHQQLAQSSVLMLDLAKTYRIGQD